MNAEKPPNFKSILEYKKNLHETIREPLIEVDPNLVVIAANDAFHKTFNLSPSEVGGS